MAAATGQSNPNPLQIHGRLWIDARNYGVSPANGNNSPNLQAAIDAAAAKAAAVNNNGYVGQVTVFVPAGNYWFGSPVYIDSPYITLQGEGQGTTLSLSRGSSVPLLLIGLPRTNGGNVPDSSYRPDLWNGGAPKLDATAVGGAGQRWGVRTRCTSSNNVGLALYSPASQFSHGGTSTYGNTTTDAWVQTTKLTIEFCVEGFASGQMPGACSLMGVGVETGNASPTPFHIQLGSANSYTVYVGTQPKQFGTPVTTAFNFSTGAATGPQKIAIQIDAGAGTFSAFLNGVQLAVTGGPLPPNSVFNENLYDQFFFNSGGSNFTINSTDIALYGLCMSRSIRYTTPGVGATAARADGGTIGDRYRYFPTNADDPQFLGYLQLTENPATAPRMLTVVGGPAACGNSNTAAFLVNNTSLNGGATAQVWIKDLRINGDYAYGSGIAMYAVLEVHFEDLQVYGGMYGIMNIPSGANYRIYLKNLALRGEEGGYFGYLSTILADNIILPSNGKACFRLLACDLDLDRMQVAGAGNPQYALIMSHQGQYGGFLRVRNVVADNEGDIFTLCGIYAEREGAGGTLLRAETINAGSMGLVPFFILKDMGPNWPAGTAILQANGVYGGYTGPMVQADGNGWAGTVAYMAGDHAQHIGNVGPTNGRVVVEDIAHVGPPHYGAWYRNSSKFLIPGAADGMFREIGVSASGTIGTAAPPQFIGRRPEQSTPNALALYAVDHTAIAATLSGQASSWGNLTDNGAVSMGNQFFASTLLGTPANWTVGLSQVDALRSGGTFEPAGTGYTAAAVPNSSSGFTAASAGVKANVAAISFGTATTAYTAKSIYIASGGTVFATIQLAQPLNVTVGMTPTIPPGALTFTHVPLPGSQFGCATDYAWKKVWDYVFGATTYTPPSQFYAALTTAPTGKTTTSLTEPSGNGYTRLACGTNWFSYNTQQQPLAQQYGDVTNAAALAFPNPTGSWGTITGGALVDASSAGNVWAVAPLTVPASPASGAGAPTFAPGAFFVTVD